MKKKISIVLSVVLVVLLCLGVAGCNNSPSPGDPAPAPAASAGDAAPPPAASPDSGAKYGPNDNISMVYLSYSMDIGWCVQVADAFEELAGAHNLTVYIGDGGFNPETQFNQLEQYIAMGVDVITIMLVDPGSAQAVADRCKEAGILMLGETAGMMDANGKLVTPCDWLFGYEVGQKEAQWVVDNYKRLGFDLSDLSKVGYIYITDSMFVEMAPRVQGAEEVWLKAFPDFPKDQMFMADRSADLGASNMEAGYNQTAAILTANPKFDQWIIVSFQEDYASGACRAVEDLGLVDKTLLVSAGGENVIPEWDAGLTKPWYAACYFTGMDSAEIIVGAIERILRQGVALEDVYPQKDPGQTYGYDTFSGVMIDFENYKSLIR